VNPWWKVDETRIGVFKQAIDDANGEGGAALNLEVLFGHLPGSYENKVLNAFLTPRLHLGTTLAFGKTDEFYWGATWDFNITDRVFFETSFGGAAHDGPTDQKVVDGLHYASYGCTVNFRESASLGFKISEDWRLLATIDHMSNAGFCDTNRGLTNAGIRLGYKW
jgi:cob(I)alamin adenosyltransferase